MSEFKFACPVCTQHIRCDSSQSGSIMDCPTCLQKIIVPMAPESGDSRIVPTGQKVGAKKTPTTVIPSQPPTPPPAAVPPALIAGVLVVLAAVAAGAAFWFWHGRTEAPEKSPVTGRTNAAAVAAAPKKPADVIPPANDTNWLFDLGSVTIPGTPAAGRIHGQDFLTERATFQNGTLTLRAGTRGPFESGLQINFQGAQPEALAGQSINVETNADQAAHVTLRWKTDGQVDKKTFENGYALRLEFGALANSHLPGKIYVSLPDPEKSYLLGTFSAVVQKPKPKAAPPAK